MEIVIGENTYHINHYARNIRRNDSKVRVLFLDVERRRIIPSNSGEFSANTKEYRDLKDEFVNHYDDYQKAYKLYKKRLVFL